MAGGGGGGGDLQSLNRTVSMRGNIPTWASSGFAVRSASTSMNFRSPRVGQLLYTQVAGVLNPTP